jgi:hypothetical protein
MKRFEVVGLAADEDHVALTPYRPVDRGGGIGCAERSFETADGRPPEGRIVVILKERLRERAHP